MGVRNSFAEDANSYALSFLYAINLTLKAHGASVYLDPEEPPNVYIGNLFGRSELDHHSSRVFVEITTIAMRHDSSPQFELIRNNPYRVTFLPVDFATPLQTDYSEKIAGQFVPIWIGSIPRLLSELKLLAFQLGIPLANGEPNDATVVAINSFSQLT